jgi:hypothetical protein
MSVESPQDRTEIFCDTSVLLSYVLDQNAAGVERLLLESDKLKVVSEKVDREFHRVPDRREDIYLDFIQIVTSDSEAIAEATVAERDYLKPNDRAFFQRLKESVTDETSIEEKLTTIREKQRIVDRRFGQLEQILHEVYPQNDDLDLLLAIGRVVENEDDCQVICDAAGWANDDGSGEFASLDTSDIVSNEPEINDKIENVYGEEDLLCLGVPIDFVDG